MDRDLDWSVLDEEEEYQPVTLPVDENPLDRLLAVGRAAIAKDIPDPTLARRERDRINAAVYRAKKKGATGTHEEIRAAVIANMRPRDADVMKTGPTKKPKPEGDRKRKPLHLDEFLRRNPDEPAIEHVADMPTDQYNRYKVFCIRLLDEKDPSRVAKRKAYNAKYDEDHREERRVKARAYRNGESYLAAQRKYKTGDTTPTPRRISKATHHVEYSRRYRFNNPTYSWNKLRTSAHRRGIKLELTFDEHDRIVTSPCDYCGEDPKNVLTPYGKGVRFGIDRVDNSRHYVSDNVVSACWFCNSAKRHHHVDDFIRGMCNVGAKYIKDDAWTPNYTFTVSKNDLNGDNYTSYRCAAANRTISFDLSRFAFDQITTAPCDYCGRNDKRMGCDRIDNNRGYSVDNCTACCSLCNMMKGKWSVGLFKEKASMIYEKTKKEQ